MMFEYAGRTIIKINDNPLYTRTLTGYDTRHRAVLIERELADQMFAEMADNIELQFYREFLRN